MFLNQYLLKNNKDTSLLLISLCTVLITTPTPVPIAHKGHKLTTNTTDHQKGILGLAGVEGGDTIGPGVGVLATASSFFSGS